MRTRKFVHGFWALVALGGFTAVVMLLWNALLPAILGVARISFWQALGLLILSRLLFGGFEGFARGAFARGMDGDKHNNFRKRWKQMTYEERCEFIKKGRGHGHHHHHDHHFFDGPDMFDEKQEETK